MAKLQNIEGDTVINLDLKLTSESPDWIGYLLKVFIKGEDLQFKIFLQLNNDSPLSFDNYMEPEVPGLFQSLNALLNEENSLYSFTPIDEKDFFLKIEKIEKKLYQVVVFFSRAKLFDSNEWTPSSMLGICMVVNQKNLLCFSNQLKTEYEKLLIPKITLLK